MWKSIKKKIKQVKNGKKSNLFYEIKLILCEDEMLIL